MQLLVTARYELVRILRNKSTYLLQLLLPLLLIFILGSALSSFMNTDQPLEEVKVAVVSQDQGALQQGLEQFLASEGIRDRLKAEFPAAEEEALAMLKEGEADLAVIIPAGFSSSVLAGEEAEWRMLTGKNSTRSLTAQMMMQGFLEETNRMQALSLVTGIGSGEAVSAAVMLPDEGDYVSAHSLADGSTGYTASQYYAAAMLIMFVLFAGMGAANSLVSERENHTLQRLSAMPVTTRAVVFGKISANGLVAIIQSVLIIVLTWWLYGVNWGSRPVIVILISILMVIASMCLALIIASLAKDSKQTNSLFNLIIVVMTFLSGGFVAVGDLADIFGKFTISHWAFQGYLRVMLNESPSAIAYYVTVLAVICAGLLAASVITYRKAGSYE
ncbi:MULTISPECIES: ABC transporter permease [Paenibacillus]|uniref:ABC transporter permease n=1 Tax=Paenibacillus residui TaxID=629724 RepID=A0ABW3D3F1_9BACL|nr:ABC transporter permease [Paenibacillus sp. 32O-W]